MPIEYHQPAVVPMSLLERLVAAGINPDRARDRITSGLVRMGGSDEPTVDPDAPCPRPTGWHIAAS